MAPGRLGTSSPELGVPVTFGDISGFRIICEISDRQSGYTPELSYGSHMFQDLVETKILYGAIWNSEKTVSYNPGYLDGTPDLFAEICPEFPELAGMIQVREPKSLSYWLDSVANHAVCGTEKAADRCQPPLFLSVSYPVTPVCICSSISRKSSSANKVPQDGDGAPFPILRDF